MIRGDDRVGWLEDTRDLTTRITKDASRHSCAEGLDFREWATRASYDNRLRIMSVWLETSTSTSDYISFKDNHKMPSALNLEDVVSDEIYLDDVHNIGINISF